MTDETNKPETTVETVAPTTTVDDNRYVELVAKFKALEESNQALLKHKNDILDEKKKEQVKRIEAEDAKLHKAGDFEQLLKSSESKNKEWEDRYSTLQNKISEEKEKTEAMRIASSIADGDNASILSDSIVKRLRFANDKINVLDRPHGDLTVSSIDELKIEFQNNARYKSLLRGNQSSGGGAAGSGNSVGAIKTMKRSEFDQLGPVERHTYLVKNKGKLID